MTTTTLPVRDRLRAEAQKLQRISEKEYAKKPQIRRQHVIDGANVARQILLRVVADLASEDSANAILEELELEAETDAE